MAPKLVTRLLLPALFLFVLGVGNIFVGLYKVSQYEEVLSELSVLQPTEVTVPLSPVGRIHRSTDRLSQTRQQVEVRLEFYRFTVSGGKLILALSTVLLLTAAAVKLRVQNLQSPIL